MKKIIAILLACVFMLAFHGCSGGNPGNGDSPSKPAQNEGFKEISVDEVPDSLLDFLTTFTDWYQGESFDSANSDGGALLCSIVSNGSCVDWSLYPDSQPVEHWGDGTEDPWGWCKDTTYSYKEYDKKTVDEIAQKVFNLSAEQIEKQVTDGVAGQIFYAEGDKYYCLIGGIGDPLTVYKVSSASSDGSKYSVNYDCYFSGEENDLMASYNAVAELKKDGDKEYWSLYSMDRTDIGSNNESNDAPTADVVDILTQVGHDVITNESTGEDVGVMMVTLNAVDADNNTVWEYTTPPCIPTELDTVQYIGKFRDIVLVNVQAVYDEGRRYDELEHHLYGLDINTGEILWDNQDFRGAGVTSAYNKESGVIFLSGYYGPDCFAVTKEGETLWVVADIDESYYWPYELNLKEDGIEIVFEGGTSDTGNEGPFYGYVSYDGVVGNG